MFKGDIYAEPLYVLVVTFPLLVSVAMFVFCTRKTFAGSAAGHDISAIVRTIAVERSLCYLVPNFWEAIGSNVDGSQVGGNVLLRVR